MNKLYILGNGFDIAHGLPTSYNEFRKWLQEQGHIIFVNRFEELYPNVKTINTKTGDMEWCDLEKALGQTTIEHMVDFDKNYSDCQCDAIATQQHEGGKIVSGTSYLQNLLEAWAKSISIDNIEREFDLPKDELFLTFNYTMTLETVYNIDSSSVVHIHNSDKGVDNLIIGYSDPTINSKYVYPKEEGEDASRRKIARGEFRRYIKDTGCQIRKNEAFFKGLSRIKEVHVFGHSLAIVDLPYIQEVSKCIDEKAIWRIYIYKKDEQKVEEVQNRLKSIVRESQKIECVDTSNFKRS